MTTSLPVPGGDVGTWGSQLNTYLEELSGSASSQPPVPASGIQQPTPPPYSLIPLGTTTSYAVATTPSTGSTQSCTLGPDGNLWVADSVNGVVWKVSPKGVALASYALPGVNNIDAWVPVVGPDGNIWIVDLAQVFQVTPGGTVTVFSGLAPFGIGPGPDGNMWLVGNTWFAVMSTSGSIVHAHDTSAGGQIAMAGLDGNMWFGAAGGSLYKVQPGTYSVLAHYTGVGGGSVLVGPDGNLWTLDYSAPQVRRTTPDGVTTGFTIAGLGQPFFEVVGPDGNIWITDSSTGYLWAINTSGAVVGSWNLGGFGGSAAIGVGPDGALWISTSSSHILRFPFAMLTSGLHLTGGQLFADGLASSDPHVLGKVWNNSGVMTVSAG